MQCKPKRKLGLHCFLFGSLEKLRFDDLSEEFLGQKNRTNRKREVFGAAPFRR